MIQAAVILLALILGYFIDIRALSNRIINHILSIVIGAIIFVMGYNFGALATEIQHELSSLMLITMSYIVALLIINGFAIWLFFTLKPKYKLLADAHLHSKKSPLKPVIQSCKYLLYLVIGAFLGIYFGVKLNNISLIIDGILIITLFIIGMQMRREGHSLTQLLKNKTGIIVACILIISSLVTGLILGLIFQISIPHALMITSGFGWYSLSSILNAQLINAHYGTITFFIDFSREILAILLIPTFAKRFGVELLGYSGATAMDFTLPVIKDNIGMHAVPVAISSGFILTIATPILIPIINLFAH
ncbi:lysine exporter LysO family protein [Fangia hongkongensis]|uniref:lysine exporter LysO family protein n=2 Tax=Fangia hongkongensis TaxID=270495 RepID=UPI0003828239|nr:lysine exporter LysO family protein [Fangia hongkongensis]